MGEIYIRTPYRTHGYLNSPQLNDEKFIPNPFTSNPDDLVFRTGDLGRFLLDGNLEILGRMDDQVKIRGIRIQLSEISNVLMGHPAVKEAAVIIGGASASNEILVAYVTGHEDTAAAEGINVSELGDYLFDRLPDYMVPPYILPLQEMPRTSSGKIDYNKLPEPVEERGESHLAPRNTVEKDF